MSATASVRRARSSIKGFTLVEILIVVIILGILAAIVIPQFTSASDDARKNSLTSQVQTLRSQIELYKLQHTTTGAELFATTTSDATTWQELTNATGKASGTMTITAPDTSCGPYLQTMPVNGLSNLSGVYVDDSVSETKTSGIPVTAGFAYNATTGKFFAVDPKTNGVYLGN